MFIAYENEMDENHCIINNIPLEGPYKAYIAL